MELATSNKIIVSRLKASTGTEIGCLTLNKPTALNALDLDMVRAIQFQLDSWRSNDAVSAVFIDSIGDRAFCAGGDIVSMYQAMKTEQEKSPGRLPDFMAAFFEEEYTLDYCIHTYPKPIICWGNGIVMGGGLGVFAGASHKIVTENSRVAMPEITIGLFPDVGASYFLSNMPAGLGLFLGLSAASINAKDCIDIKLADYFVLHSQKEQLLEVLLTLSAHSHDDIRKACQRFESLEASQQVYGEMRGNLDGLQAPLAIIQDIDGADEFAPILVKLIAQHSNNKVLRKALHSFNSGSPITANLVFEQLKRAKHMSLADCFIMELCMAYKCSVLGEFQEGVRALLIDKDMQAKWLYRNIAEVPKQLIEEHFSLENNRKNPLLTLAQRYGE